MELKDVKLILSRIKSNYPNFVNDDFTRSEWYKELKDYSLEDVMKKLEEHFRSETYGNQIPKVYFLTKYLVKEKDKDDRLIKQLRGFCPICHQSVLMVEYENHYRKCGSIDYIIKQVKRFKGIEYTYDDIASLSEEKFDKVYEKVLNLTYEMGDDKERQSIDNYRECLANGGLCDKDINGVIN